MNEDKRERVLVSVFGEPSTVTRTCVICGKNYSYKGGTNFFWKGTGDPMGKGDVLRLRNKKQIWPNDCCEEHRTLECAKQYIEGESNGKEK